MDRRAIPILDLEEYRQPAATLREFSIDTVEHSIHSHPRRAKPHSHPFFQVLISRGPGILMRDFVEHRLSGVCLAFLGPGEVHCIPRSPRLRGYFASFTQSFFDGRTPPPSRLLEGPFFFGSIAILPVLEREAQARFSAVFEEMVREYQEERPGGPEVLRALLEILLTRAARLCPGGSGALTRPAQLARTFRLLVERHFRERHLPAAYAPLLGVTANHLNDTVRGQSGQSAGGVIRERQVLEAKRLLLHSAWSISEIAYHLGFKDPSYFSRFFARHTGGSPGAFREEIREKYLQGAL